jgi:5-formyltetrahydrofolate cyclo-ligase
LAQYHTAQRLSVYLSMPTGEISTAAIVQDAMNRGKQVFVPYTYQIPEEIENQPSQIMDMLELKSLEDYAALEPDKWGIPTLHADSVGLRRNSFGTFGMSDGKIPENSSAFGLDLIVVPGMAFDRNMGRLGHGKGFYDYFLERCHRHSVQGQTKMPFLGMTRYSISLLVIQLAYREQSVSR